MNGEEDKKLKKHYKSFPDIEVKQEWLVSVYWVFFAWWWTNDYEYLMHMKSKVSAAKADRKVERKGKVPNHVDNHSKYLLGFSSIIC